MGTVVTVQVVGHGATEAERREREDGVARALDWFLLVEDHCSRFDAESEVARLSTHVGVAVPVSTLVFQAVHFALAVADVSGGAFDPTVGRQMEARGFDRNFRTGEVVRSDVSAGVTYRDVILDADAQTIMLSRPLTLDLGAVAKGLAIDAAARELQPFTNFAIDAGGDLYLAGCNVSGNRWPVGIRHPRSERDLIDTLHVSNTAVCTSGDYQRPQHIIDARNGVTATASASVTVLAPSAMVADALATAAFVLGPAEGLALLEEQGVEGMIVTAALDVTRTSRMRAA